MNNMLKNWKTTSAGVVMCVGSVLTYLNDKSQLVACLTAFLGGMGLILSKDSDQTGVAKQVKSSGGQEVKNSPPTN